MDQIREDLYNYNPWWEGEYAPQYHPRERYLRVLRNSLNRREVEILTGLRRVGKTSIMKLFISELCRSVEPGKIFYASLDSISLEKFQIAELVREFRKIHQHRREEKIYLFFDEAAYRENLHLELKNLYDSENVKVFVSGSSSSVLRDKGALLTGRTRVTEINPLSFSEYLEFRNITIKNSELYLTEKYFEEYMQDGGMPEYILTKDVEYLNALIDSIIYKDIAFYRGVRDTSSLKEFFRLLMERAGKQLSINKISKVTGISPETAARYFEYFQSTYLIYAIERCGKLNERVRAPKKIYAADTGIRNFITGFRDKGAVFENLFYLLIREKSPCYIYKNTIELDFFCQNTLYEIKYGRELPKNQEELFNSFPAANKYLISGIQDYMSFVEGKAEK